MSISESIPIVVSEHAMWRAAERFRRFDTSLIEREVRAALRAGRVSKERTILGQYRKAKPGCLYVWTPDGERVYALRHDPSTFVVTTVLRR